MNSSPNEFTKSSKSASSIRSLAAEPKSTQVPEAQKPSSVASAPESPNHEEIPTSLPVSALTNPETNHEIVGSDRDDASEIESIGRQHPIPPPSEPKQYRAIGLVHGHYRASDDQFTKGALITPDGTEIDAVLLGRVMSLVKNHIDLKENHLWVVYPRTRQKNGELHLQIVGIWEPEQLSPKHKAIEDSDLSAEATPDQGSPSDAKTVETSEYPPLDDGYFSIRGEVVYQSEPSEDQEPPYIIIKIKQHPRQPSDEPKFFKLKLQGSLEGKAVGRFWDLHLQREGQNLSIKQGNDLGLVGPTKAKKGSKPSGGRPGGGTAPRYQKSFQRPDRKPAQFSPPTRSSAVPKPAIKKRQKPDSET
jgi:hypothetical protein